jgi:uncharacterized protein (DUF2147 family)
MKRLATLAALGVLTACAARATPPAAPIGRWVSATGNVEVTIHPCGNALCGDVVRVLANNAMEGPGPAKVPPAQVGLQVMSDFRPDGDAWKGRIYDRDNGRTYDCRISLQGPDALVVRPFIVLPVFGKTQIWRRVPG